MQVAAEDDREAGGAAGPFGPPRAGPASGRAGRSRPLPAPFVVSFIDTNPADGRNS